MIRRVEPVGGILRGVSQSFEMFKEFLSHFAVPRRVDGSGKIGLFGGKLYVGTRHIQTDVLLQFNPTRSKWVVGNRQNQQLARVPAAGISQRSILSLKAINPFFPTGKTFCRDFAAEFHTLF